MTYFALLYIYINGWLVVLALGGRENGTQF